MLKLETEENDDEMSDTQNKKHLHNSCHKKLSKEENKERKKQFKAAKADSRTSKTPKHVKKSRDSKYRKK